MKTWKATFLVIYIMSLFTYLTFVKENPVNCWWWALGVFFILQTYLHDAEEDHSEKTEEDENE